MKVLKAVLSDYIINQRRDIIVTVEHDTEPADLRYEERAGMFRADNGDAVRYFYWTRPGDGFGGSIFHITMKDGTLRALKGPWSSRAGCVNRVFHDLPHVVDCVTTDRMGCAIKLDVLKALGLEFTMAEDGRSDLRYDVKE